MRFKIRYYGDRFYEKPEFEGITVESIWSTEKTTEHSSSRATAVLENGEAVLKWISFYYDTREKEFYNKGRNHKITYFDHHRELEREVEAFIYYINFDTIESLVEFLSNHNATIARDGDFYEIGIDTGYDC